MKNLTRKGVIVVAMLCLFAGSAAAYPLGGTDTFPVTQAQFDLVLPDGSVEPLALTGPMVVVRGDPFDNGGGQQAFDTEIVSMDLSGSSPSLGSLALQGSALLPSTGLVQQQTPGTDFPADSFFDVFVEVNIPATLGTLLTLNPIRLATEINRVPPEDGTQWGDGGRVRTELVFENEEPSGLFISNLRLTTMPVPEPGTIALVGLGLLGVARRVRKRRSSR